MKKKFSLWLNIVTICLCVCAIAIGVYSATTATLKVSGQIGFEAHGCEIVVEGTLSGYVTSADSKEIQNNQPLETVELNNDEKAMVISDESKPEETKYFTDLVGDSVTPITLKLDITNNSKFKVRANVTVPNQLTDNNISISADKTTMVLNENAGTGDILLTFRVINPNNDAQVTLSAVENLKIEFVKFDGNYNDGEYFIDEENKLTVYMGHGTPSDNAIDVRLPWQAFAVLGEGSDYTKPEFVVSDLAAYTPANTTEKWYSLAGTTMTLENAKGHTFWFIQKYVTVTTGKQFNASNNDGSVYANTTPLQTPVTSDLFEYVTGAYITDAGINNNSTYYNSIHPRTVNEKQLVDNLDHINAFTSSLWILSQSELNLLVGQSLGTTPNTEVEIAYGIGNVLGDASGNGAEWWTRSPDGSQGAWYIRYDGRWFPTGLEGARGIRAAFQISIA